MSKQRSVRGCNLANYRCQIEIDVEAESPEKAAQLAYQMLRDPTCTPWVVKTCDTAHEHLVDLEAEGTGED